MRRLVGSLALLLLVLQGAAHAQESRESTLTLRVESNVVHGDWKVPLHDLDAALRLDADADGEIAWPEIAHRRQEIEQYLDSHLRIVADGTGVRTRFDKLLFGSQQDEPFLMSQLSFAARSTIHSLDIDYTVLFDLRPDHRGLIRVVWPDRGTLDAVITAPGSATVFHRENAQSKGFIELLYSGMWHIWIGYDHVLFLLVLLIPAVYRRTTDGRETVPDFAGAFGRVAIIVSAFTVAHSITLTCAALQWIVLPARFVESAIAASVIIAALLNLLPRTAGASSAWAAFGFGLLHGFGFANVLGEVDAEGTPLWRILLGFNLGVEIGQLAIVAVFLPLAFLLRDTHFYRTGVLYGGSTAAAACAMFWFWQRAF